MSSQSIRSRSQWKDAPATGSWTTCKSQSHCAAKDLESLCPNYIFQSILENIPDQGWIWPTSIVCTVSRIFDGVWKTWVQNSNPIKCYWWCIYNAWLWLCVMKCGMFMRACDTWCNIYQVFCWRNKLEISVWLWEVGQLVSSKECRKEMTSHNTISLSLSLFTLVVIHLHRTETNLHWHPLPSSCSWRNQHVPYHDNQLYHSVDWLLSALNVSKMFSGGQWLVRC